MSHTVAALLALAGLAGALAASAEPKSEWAKSEPPAPVAAARQPLRVVYFVPTDRKPEPNFAERLDRLMTHVQSFYREGMARNGHGKLTFELERGSDGKLIIHHVAARGPMRDYGRDAAGKVRREVRDALAEKKIDLDRETVIVFQLLLDWQGDKAVEIGPFVGGGGPRSGTAWVYDDAKLDPELLGSREPGGSYAGRPCSLGQFNTHYIGGVIHELGHGLGLPHDSETDAERATLGRSLMGAGNHVYGRELRGEGRGAFLSAASALPLSVHPLFTGRPTAATEMTCRLTELSAAAEPGTLSLSGRLEGGPPVVGVIAFNDPLGAADDYDAVGWVARPDADGRFRLRLGELKPGEYELRLRAIGGSGDSRTQKFRYSVDGRRQPDPRPFDEWVPLQQAQAAFRADDKARLAEILARLRAAPTADAGSDAVRRVAHLQRLLTPTALRTLAEIGSDEPTVALSDLRLATAEVGWGRAWRNRTHAEGEASVLLSVGGRFFESGLYAHAPARHGLRLDGKWAKLITKFGLQDGSTGSVAFVIRGDGRELFRSNVVRDHVVREATVELTGVTQLELIVEDARDGRASDWGVWLEPQLRR